MSTVATTMGLVMAVMVITVTVPIGAIEGLIAMKDSHQRGLLKGTHTETLERTWTETGKGSCEKLLFTLIKIATVIGTADSMAEGETARETLLQQQTRDHHQGLTGNETIKQQEG